MYCFTVGFVSGDSPPQLLLGPEVSVAEQEESLQEKARVDDGGEFSAIEIVYSNGRPTRRVDFTPASVKEAAAAAAAEKADAEAAAAAAAKAARRAELEAELAALNAEEVSEPWTEDKTLRWNAAIKAGASASLPEVDLDADDEATALETTIVSPEAAALDADDEAAAAEAVADPAPVSGKRKR